jgi:hypothetical protein
MYCIILVRRVTGKPSLKTYWQTLLSSFSRFSFLHHKIKNLIIPQSHEKCHILTYKYHVWRLIIYFIIRFFIIIFYYLYKKNWIRRTEVVKEGFCYVLYLLVRRVTGKPSIKTYWETLLSSFSRFSFCITRLKI